ncbi:MAG: ATP--guanido phosphotransferase [Armatimonadetes bacterium]|nr:ATP--guanido phosphotransferase [Armatimonadota bacterium]
MLLTHFDKTARWMRRGGREGDVVLSSRVRLARNFRRAHFPHLAPTQDLLSIRTRTLAALETLAEAAPAALLVVPFEKFTPWERQSLLDRHFTSRGHIKEELGRAIAATGDGALCVLINEEDHLRLQSLLPGLQFDAAYAVVDKMDDALEAHFDTRGGFAFEAQFGYLTACPTNAGTGLRASAMLHLPALEIVEKLEKTRKWAASRGLDLRGTFGEDSKVWGHLHQLSNRATLGLDETEILLEMDAATREICELERAARAQLPHKNAVETRDHIGRAFGLLRHARIISCREATEALSFVRLGHEMGWMKGLSRQRFNELLVWIRPAYLQVLHGRSLAGAEREALRANLLRQHIARVKLEAAFEE